MISKGADDWNMGLYDACQGGHLELAKLMISNGANDWHNGFRGACRADHLELIQLMVSKGISKADIRTLLSEHRYTTNTNVNVYLKSQLE